MIKFIITCNWAVFVASLNILDYSHYFDYLPLRQEGLAGFEDFRTSLSPPSALRNRKMEIGQLKVCQSYCNFESASNSISFASNRRFKLKKF